MEILIPVFIAIVAFITRIVNLLNIPIFTDEAIYIRWAQIGLADPAHRYISLTDGKQPLLTWLMYPSLTIFSDPLFAGRFISVLSAVFAVLGVYFVVKELFGKKTAFFACFLYLISPFTLIYDRLALMDSLLVGLGMWSLYLQILLIKAPRLDLSLLLGVTVGLGFLTKSSASFFLYFLPANLLLFNFRSKRRVKRLLKWSGLSILSIIISQLMYHSLRLSPWFYIIEQKNYSFILTFKEFFDKPFSLFWSNLNGLLKILISYLTWPIFIVLVIALIFGLIKKDKKVLYLFIWFLFPFLSLACFGKVIFPRFILFMIIPLLIIIGDTLFRFAQFSYKKIKIFLVIIPLILLYPFYQSYLILTSPVDVSIPNIDRNQLFDDWPSGYGVREVIDYLSQKAKLSKIVIGTEGTFGLNPAVYEIYFQGNKNVEIYGFWPVSKVPELLLEKARFYPTYLIFKEKQDIPKNWPLVLIKKYRRGKGDTYLLFYQVKPAN